MAATPPSAGAPSSLFSAGTRRYVLTILVIAYTFNFIDRQILGILVEPIRLELGVLAAAGLSHWCRGG